MPVKYYECHVRDRDGGKSEGMNSLRIRRYKKICWKASKQTADPRKPVTASRLYEIVASTDKAALFQGAIDQHEFAVAIAEAWDGRREVK
jgi:hypothetical protein